MYSDPSQENTSADSNITEEETSLPIAPDMLEPEVNTLPIEPIKPNNSKRKIQIGSLVLSVIVGGTALYFANRITQPTPKTEQSHASVGATVPWTYPRPVKVIIMRYFNPASQAGAKDPVVAQSITDNMQANLYEASRFHNIPGAPSAIKIQVVGQYDFGPAPNINNDWEATYNNILTTALPNDTQNACDKINAQGVDEVWLLGDPTIPGFTKGPEFAVSSKYLQPGAIATPFDITVLPKQPFCGGTHSLLMFFMDLSRPGASVHAFGHYMETLLGMTQSYDLFYKNYMGVDYLSGSPGNGVAIPGISIADRCGSIHVPPNVPVIANTNPAQYLYQRPNYSYGTVVNSSCPNWKPDGTGQKVGISASTWINNPTLLAGDPEFKFHMWWLENLPNISNGLTYSNLPLPNWWDFVADTDNTIAWYLNSPYFMNPDLFSTLYTNKTTACTGISGVSSTCTTNGATLGAQTENDTVLGTSTYGDLALVTVLYSGSVSTPNAAATTITYCGDPMTRIGNAPVSGTGFKSEMWYKSLPKSGSCPIVVTFNVNPGQRIITSTLFNNIDTVAPIANFTSSVYTSPTLNAPGKVTMSLAGPKNSLMLCAYDLYSEQTNAPGPNRATADPGTLSMWKFEDALMNGAPANVWGGLGAGAQRTADNQMLTLSWSTVKTMPWSATCANLNVKPFTPGTSPTPAPTVLPTGNPTPTPIPTLAPGSIPLVDIQANSQDRLYGDTVKGTTVTLSWTTTGASTCKALGNWSGVKPVNGSATLTLPTVNSYYAIQCTGPTGLVSYDLVYVYARSTQRQTTILGKLFIDGFDNTLPPAGSGLVNLGNPPRKPIAKGTSPVLTYVISGYASCTSSWTKAVLTPRIVEPPITVNTAYSLTCQTSPSVPPSIFSVTAYVK